MPEETQTKEERLEEMPEWAKGLGLAGVFLQPFFAGLVLYAARGEFEKEQSKYIKETSPLCSQFMEEADIDKTGALGPREIVDLARKVGYKETFPTNPLVAQLRPGNYENKDVILRVSGGSWREEYRFPKSRLAEIIRRPQHRGE